MRHASKSSMSTEGVCTRARQCTSSHIVRCLFAGLPLATERGPAMTKLSSSMGPQTCVLSSSWSSIRYALPSSHCWTTFPRAYPSASAIGDPWANVHDTVTDEAQHVRHLRENPSISAFLSRSRPINTSNFRVSPCALLADKVREEHADTLKDKLLLHASHREHTLVAEQIGTHCPENRGDPAL